MKELIIRIQKNSDSPDCNNIHIGDDNIGAIAGTLQSGGESMKRYFLTVDWCSKGNRGIFCNKDGNCFSKETQHTEDEMWEILGAFDLILAPQSIEMDENELKTYRSYIPLAEYSHQYGIATKKLAEVKL